MAEKKKDPVAVTSRSFSRHPILRAELLEKYERVMFNDAGKSLGGAELVAFLRGHKRAILALESLDEAVLSQLPDLEVVSKYGVGIDKLDLSAMKRFDVRLGWKGGVNKRSVAELALAFAISLLRQVPRANLEVRNQVWRQLTGNLLTGRTVGIIGCGHVGKDFIQLLRPFNCRILIHDILDLTDFAKDVGAETLSLDALLKQSDVVSLHVPLNPSTRSLINRDRLRLMKVSAVLINTARGGIVDEEALKEWLKEGKLTGAAFDVFIEEPPRDNELLALPNFLATPHIGGSAEEAILAMGRAAIAGLEEARDADSFV